MRVDRSRHPHRHVFFDQNAPIGERRERHDIRDDKRPRRWEASRSFGAGLSSSSLAAPLSHGSKSFSGSSTGIRSATLAANLFGSQMDR